MTCGDNCEAGNKVVICLDDAPEEIVALVKTTAQVAVDYGLAVTGVKKRATAARKGLMEIKRMTTDMRKSALEKCNKAREDASE